MFQVVVRPLRRLRLVSSYFQAPHKFIYSSSRLHKENYEKKIEDELNKLNASLKDEAKASPHKDAEQKNFINFKQRNERQAEAELQRKLTAGKARIGGEWELVNTDGKLEGSKELAGNWLLLYFGFTNCPDICPDEIEKMVKVVEKLDEDTNPAIKVLPIFISVDPARDTVERVKEYCREFSPRIKGFTGSKEQVNAVAKTFRVYHSEGPKTTEDDYIVDHTVIMYLIDPEGKFCDYYGQNRTAVSATSNIYLRSKYESRKHFSL